MDDGVEGWDNEGGGTVFGVVGERGFPTFGLRGVMTSSGRVRVEGTGLGGSDSDEMLSTSLDDNVRKHNICMAQGGRTSKAARRTGKRSLTGRCEFETENVIC